MNQISFPYDGKFLVAQTVLIDKNLNHVGMAGSRKQRVQTVSYLAHRNKSILSKKSPKSGDQSF
jgi:hypothetical protein